MSHMIFFFFALGVYRTSLWHMAGFYSYMIVFWPVGLDRQLKALDFSKHSPVGFWPSS